MKIKQDKIPVLVIAGPTGVGKTDLSIKLSHLLDGEVINADSLQFYQGLDIGTGKIKEAEKEGVPHHLIDILPAHQAFDVSQFVDLADQTIQEIHHRGSLPIIVGGSGLYIESLLFHLELGQDKSANPIVRHALEDRLERMGDLALWQELKQIDPQAAAKIPYQNSRRVIRALEVIEVTGQLFSDQRGHQDQDSRYQESLWILDRPRPNLYQRINQRVLQMVEEGLEEEVYGLYQASQGQPWQSLKAIGYKEWFPYFEGKISLQEVISQVQQNSRRYAKRQLTWFRNRFKQKHWLDLESDQINLDQMVNLIKKDWV